MMKNNIIASFVGLICAFVAMLIIILIEASGCRIPEFWRGLIFASAFLAGRNTSLDFLKQN
jgi:hypothetical protein